MIFLKELLKRLESGVRGDQRQIVLEPVIYRLENIHFLIDRISEKEMIFAGPLKSKVKKLIAIQSGMKFDFIACPDIQRLFAGFENLNQSLLHHPLPGDCKTKLIALIVNEQFKSEAGRMQMILWIKTERFCRNKALRLSTNHYQLPGKVQCLEKIGFT